MWDNLKRKAIDLTFGTKPNVLGNIARGNPFNLNLPGGIQSPLPANQSIKNPPVMKTPAVKTPPIPLPMEIKTPAPKPIKVNPPKIGPQILSPLGKAVPKAQAQTKPTVTPTPDPRASWDNFSSMVIREGDKRGYSGKTLAQQKALESAYGTSNFAKERFNYGGVGAYDADPNKAFKFNSPEDYLNYYFKLIQNKYPKAYANRADPKKYVQELKNGGYASDPNYVWKVLNTPVTR